MVSEWWQAAIGAAGGLVLVEALLQFLVYRPAEKKAQKEKQNVELNTEVLFFPDNEDVKVLKPWGRTVQPTKMGKAYMRMVHVLEKSKKSLDICHYVITHPLLGQLVLDLYDRGVRVRVITDSTNTGEDGGEMRTQITTFRRKGILVRTKHEDHYDRGMVHHKFVISDKKTLITGSLNWTKNSFNGSIEDVLITNQPPLVKPFLAEFDRIWELFKPKDMDEQA